jgi:hypothetical protein
VADSATGLERIVVAPFDQHVLSTLKHVPIVIRLRHQREIAAAVDCARHLHLHLHGLFVDATTPLCAIDVEQRWADSAIALFVPSAGRYREFQPLVRRLRPLRIRVFLPATTRENVLAVRILAAEGVRSAVVLKPPVAAWDALSDLMVYAIAARGHAPIEPFDFIARQTRSGARPQYGSVYFDDPSAFLHVDPAGRVALTADDLSAQRFVADSVDDVCAVPESRRCELPAAPCASCRGWPACQGRFAAEAVTTDHCRRFFTDMLDTIAGIHASEPQGS